jgi:hypothetical protein
MRPAACSAGFFGMPRLRFEHEKCTFFAVHENGGRIGTGFIVERAAARGTRHLYGVTNHHVAQTGGGRLLAINTKAGVQRQIETEDRDWCWSSDADVAAIDLSDHLTDDDDFAAISETEFVTDRFLQRADLGLGDEVFLIGLFAPHSGVNKVIASARFGSLSILADNEAPVGPYRKGGVIYRPRGRYVADMRSRPGYSGSPVFVYRTVFVDLRNFKGDKYVVDLGEISSERLDTFVRLLGMHCSQFTDDVIVDDNSPMLSGHTLFMPGAMAVIIPAWEITAVLDRPEFEERRAMRDAKRVMRDPIRAESSGELVPTSARDAEPNPEHRRDFNRLVGAASKRKPKGDRT